MKTENKKGGSKYVWNGILIIWNEHDYGWRRKCSSVAHVVYAYLWSVVHFARTISNLSIIFFVVVFIEYVWISNAGFCWSFSTYAPVGGRLLNKVFMHWNVIFKILLIQGVNKRNKLIRNGFPFALLTKSKNVDYKAQFIFHKNKCQSYREIYVRGP